MYFIVEFYKVSLCCKFGLKFAYCNHKKTIKILGFKENLMTITPTTNTPTTGSNVAPKNPKTKLGNELGTQATQTPTLKSLIQKPTTSATDDIKDSHSPFASEPIKSANASIGKLQTLKKSLDSIDSHAQKAQKVYDDQKKLGEIRAKVDNIIDESKFEGSKVFGVDIKDSKGSVVLKAIKLNTSLLEGDKREIEVFNYEVKEVKKQIKPAIDRLSIDINNNLNAQEESATKDVKSQGLLKNLDKEPKEEGKIAKFFRKMGNYLRSSHNPNRLDSERVSKLLS